MPARFIRSKTVRTATAGLGAGLLMCLTAPGAWAQAAPAGEQQVAKNTVNNSSLDAALFYQLLIGEIELRSGGAGTAYEVILDAARKENDEQLFKRAADIALQARAGDQALTAARAWRDALPSSLEAHRYVIQLLVAMGKPAETAEPLRSLIKLTPEADRNALISALPRFFVNTSDRKLVPPLLEKVLSSYREAADTRLASLHALSAAWLGAQEPKRALPLLQEAQALAPDADATVVLALQMLPGTPEAEAIVAGYLLAKPANSGIRILYARVLSGAQRYGDAITQLEQVTKNEPERATAWLTLGALQLEMRQAKDATRSLETYLKLAPEDAAISITAGDEDADGLATGEQARVQAWLMLAQAAEQLKDYKGAEAWLARIDNPKRALEVQQRRASLLMHQGKVAEARALIRQLPEKDADAARAKLFAEAQLLRDAKLWKEANAVLAKGSERFANDTDLLYEQSMMAEKLDRLDEMERLLRQVIELKPEHQHAHNALGYSLAERNLRLPEAKQLIEKALSLSPGDPFITDSLGWVEYRLGNTAEAIRLLRQAYQARPDTEIGAHLGEVLWVSGQTDEARRIWREARGRDAANDVLRETLARLRADL